MTKVALAAPKVNGECPEMISQLQRAAVVDRMIGRRPTAVLGRNSPREQSASRGAQAPRSALAEIGGAARALDGAVVRWLQWWLNWGWGCAVLQAHRRPVLPLDLRGAAAAWASR